jgi:nucleoside-diphosphate-sugar epimerase
VKVLVTGGAGFIGSNLVRELLDRGHDVRVLDNFSTGLRANLAGLDGVEVVEGELRSYERVHAAVRGAELVFHLGALGSVPRSVQDPLTSSAVNVEGTLNVLLAARDEAVRRVVFSSSTSVYGSSRMLPTAESQPPDPISPYGVAKLAAERYCVSFSRVYDLETVVLRYFNVFGPRQSPLSQYAAVIPLFIAAISKGEPIVIHGDGEQSRDFTYVSNVLDATIRAGEAAGASGRIFNVAAGAPASVNAVAETIGRLLDRPVEKHSAPPRAGDIRDSWADISAARDVLGYEPAVGLDEGLRLTIEALAT